MKLSRSLPSARRAAAPSGSVTAAAGLLLSLVLCCPSAAQPIPAERTSNVAGASGEEIRAGHYENTGGRGCPQNLGDPQVVVEQAPANGAVTVRPGEAEVGQFLLGGNGSPCPGKVLQGTHVFYRSKPGFRGTDAFACRVVFNRGTLLVRYVVQVR